jgi:hypothetical protein
MTPTAKPSLIPPIISGTRARELPANNSETTRATANFFMLFTSLSVLDYTTKTAAAKPEIYPAIY